MLGTEGIGNPWHVVPRHSRVPNVKEFGSVSRRLELGYKAIMVVIFIGDRSSFFFYERPLLSLSRALSFSTNRERAVVVGEV